MIHGKPRILDLFCGAGGAAAGYVRAGFEVIGVDNRRQKRYHLSGSYSFILADAVDYARENGSRFDAIHASPPCQAYSPLRYLHSSKIYPDLIGVTREVLNDSGVPWIIENVMTAPLVGGIALCGSMFGLRTYRHRRFESSFPLSQPIHPRHEIETVTRQRRNGWDSAFNVSVVGNIGREIGGEALGIDWMTAPELSQSVPPAYTHYIGIQLYHFLSTRVGELHGISSI